MSKKISFVIPCYGSESTLATVVNEVRQVVQKECTEFDYEFVMVSDASPDNVGSVIQQLCRDDSQHCIGIELARNFGQHAALMAGYRIATGDFIFSLDDDGQAPVESIPEMMRALINTDIVFGSYAHKKHNIFRNLGSRVNDFMAEKLIGKPKNLQVTSFFVMKRFVVNEVVKYENGFPYVLGLLLRSSKYLANVPVNHRERAEGTSGYTFNKLFRLWLNGFTAFSVVPLRWATLCGFICAVGGFLGGMLCIANKLCRPDVPIGYSSLMTVLIFIGGMLMLMLGLIGEYVGRSYLCLNHAPQYVIRKKYNLNLNP